MLFFLNSITTTLIFIRVATKWRLIMMFWEKNESTFLRHPYRQTDNLRRKIVISSTFMFLFAAGELKHA